MRRIWVLGCLAVVLSLAISSGCAVLRREKLPPATLAPDWQRATLAELLGKIRVQQDAIRTFQATVEIEPSVTSLRRGEIVHYRDVRAFILIRLPAFLRMIGLYPVAQTTAFDMASNGERFGLYIPSRNRFIIGNSREGRRSDSALENLRPQHILDALLWQAPEPGREQAVLEASAEGPTSYYIVHVLRPAGERGFVLARNFWFERRKLSLERLQIFDDEGEEVTDARYLDYAEFSGIPYARKITIDRPKDHYGLALTVSKLDFNQPLEDDKFRLEQPPGTELQNLEEQSLAGKANDRG